MEIINIVDISKLVDIDKYSDHNTVRDAKN